MTYYLYNYETIRKARFPMIIAGLKKFNILGKTIIAPDRDIAVKMYYKKYSKKK